jgi:hypothetical protein
MTGVYKEPLFHTNRSSGLTWLGFKTESAVRALIDSVVKHGWLPVAPPEKGDSLIPPT